MPRTAVLRCVLAAVLFGAAAPATSRLAGDIPAFTLAGLLYLGAALAVAGAAMAHPPSRAAIARDRRGAAVVVVAGGMVGPLLLVSGLARTSAASASLLLNLELVATVAIAASVYHEHLGRRVGAATILIVAAGALMTWRSGARVDSGALLVAGAAACWGLDNAVTARIENLAPAHLVLFKGTIAGSVNLVIGLAVSGVGTGTRWTDVVAAMVIGSLGYGVSILLWIKGARDLGGARAQMIFAAAPFVGAVLAWTALAEAVSALQVVATVVAAAGVALSLGSAHEHAHRHIARVHEHEHVHDDGHHDHHDDGSAQGRHAHPHRHSPVVHVHDHVPDLHHAHDHRTEG